MITSLWHEFLLRVLVAFLAGILIGFERQWRQRMAGLQTNVLVSVGAALFVSLGVMVAGEASPTRIASQVVSGIGFLGAGVIIRDGLSIRGLNTAATLWCAAAIGTLAGAGYLWQALAGAAFIILTNTLLRIIARELNDRTGKRTVKGNYLIEITCQEKDEAQVRMLLLTILHTEDIGIKNVTTVPERNHQMVVRALLLTPLRRDEVIERIIGRLSVETEVDSVGWRWIDEDEIAEVD
ncbi:putative Mg2+ transporter-C (MgtC) family protein [Seinonella peptonophila]|uniref:Putative Mg2+ transporter-C (MgtC) family protein n=1 Tax=Seinonella peptonophila TaxID=112248 RepID=A0A1M4ZJU5_9BACL|nr:MgtC/SapB family protein [Seinonella peptonophila]SHF18235.1 putative Mg2+ transporter-C (MgtC) family protein [Seinonella peptonophila]